MTGLGGEKTSFFAGVLVLLLRPESRLISVFGAFVDFGGLGVGDRYWLLVGVGWCWFVSVGVGWCRLVSVGVGWCRLVSVGVGWCWCAWFTAASAVLS